MLQRSSRILNTRKTDKPNFGGLDWIKLLAALLVVANHTSPLLSFGSDIAVVLSGIVTRIAVPIFFMTSGFFYFRKLTRDPRTDNRTLRGYLGKIGKLYGIAILLYVPFNLYTGYFKDDFSAYSLFKDIVFDGTFYHLWYLPALLIGISLTSYLYRKVSLDSLLAISGMLYIVGLLGDSYYGFIASSPGISDIYDSMFTVFDYTRNGLFYAPIYIALGAFAARRKQRVRSPLANACLFFGSLVCLLGEGMLLHSTDMPRHDSMYVFALPATYYLFQWALQWKGKSNKVSRDWRVWIYILHPAAIVFVRGAAKAVKLESIFIANSLIHFVSVCLLSIIMAAVAVKILGFRRK
ncbi:acyltransferase family protein [Cohnella lupini]|uniref:acyltransferase family protein n=1 Tax=Cohnella lupini TaxID=1294267 RepID=UPI0015F296FA|nr:acyltransferase [Cohnella lupini]